MRDASVRRPAVNCARGSMPCSPKLATRVEGCGGAASIGCATSRTPTRRSRRRTGVAHWMHWSAPGTGRRGHGRRPRAHRGHGAARVCARPLRRKVGRAAAGGHRPGEGLRSATAVRRRAPCPRRLGPRGAARPPWRRAGPGGSARRADAGAAAGRGGPNRSTPSMALTPKEREVLELLARNLSNKEIGLAMQVGKRRSSGT